MAARGLRPVVEILDSLNGCNDRGHRHQAEDVAVLCFLKVPSLLAH